MSKDSHGKFRKACLTRSLNKVDQIDVSFQAFNDTPHLISSQALRRCLIITIASHFDAVISYISLTKVDEVPE